MKYDYIFFEEDASFTYLGPFGPQVHNENELHGFSIHINSQNQIDIKSLQGFGAFHDVEKCKTLEELYHYIDKYKIYVSENYSEIKSYEMLELLIELQEIIIENLKEKAKLGEKTDLFLVCSTPEKDWAA